MKTKLSDVLWLGTILGFAYISGYLNGQSKEQMKWLEEIYTRGTLKRVKVEETEA